MRGKARLAAVLLSAVMLSGCSVEDTSADRVRERGTVRIALEEGSELDGLSEYIADSLGAAPEIITADKAEALDLIRNDKADVAIGYYAESNNPGLDICLTVPFHYKKVYAVVLSDLFITGSGDLSDKQLGCDDTMEQESINAIKLLSTDEAIYRIEPVSAAEMLKAESLYAYLCYEDTAFEMVSGGSELRCYIIEDIQPQRYCAAVMRDNTQLCGEINTAIGTFLAGGN